ncbi:hypothetical protein Cni_G29301 [Canna indica]|uniref:DUF4283 domain-containing protein n=1 Tax=Canna indica TaxID=4628 RepID=A0AAQ3QPH0_9LILI|nr:hypothetical protein Cni_G29301 [Canna indica]
MNLRLEFWSASIIGKIMSRIGKPLHMDRPTATKSRIGYARVCIEMEGSDNFFENLAFTVRDVQYDHSLEYDWKPSSFTHCSTFGHSNSKCPSLPKKVTHVWVPKMINAQKDLGSKSYQTNMM